MFLILVSWHLVVYTLECLFLDLYGFGTPRCGGNWFCMLLPLCFLVYLFVSFVKYTTYEIIKVTNFRDLLNITINYLYPVPWIMTIISFNIFGNISNSIRRFLHIFMLMYAAIFILSLIIGIVFILFINTTSA